LIAKLSRLKGGILAGKGFSIDALSPMISSEAAQAAAGKANKTLSAP
jgi:hypothetical protein